MDPSKIKDFINRAWESAPGRESALIKALAVFVTIENDSAEFDPGWAGNGRMDAAVAHLAAGLEEMKAEFAAGGAKVDDVVVRTLGGPDQPELDPGGQRRSPVLLVEAPAFGPPTGPASNEPGPEGTVLLYGHLDKQPGLAEQWSEGLGPRSPVIRDGKLYGRGAADDGYALFSAFSAVMALRAQGAGHGRCVILIESGEESGSPDLEFYIKERLRERLGPVDLIVCLDSGCETYDRLWSTTSLRGLVSGLLRVRVAREGIHSGDASGVVPSSFRIARQLLSRLEDEATGRIAAPELAVDLSPEVRAGAEATARVLGPEFYAKFPLLEGVRPAEEDLTELVLDRNWRTQLAVIGQDGLPPTRGAGNVMLPAAVLGLSFRLPPTLDSGKAGDFIKKVLEADPPFGARVEFTVQNHGDGWAAPSWPGWLARAAAESSRRYFGREHRTMGEGGSIPFMSMLGEVFPRAAFFVTGVCGPGANAHGPDEFLHLPAAEKVTMCVAEILNAHFTHADIAAKPGRRTGGSTGR